MSGPVVKPEVDSMIEDLQLVDKANQKSSALSGGQKRKLRCVHTCGSQGVHGKKCHEMPQFFSLVK